MSTALPFAGPVPGRDRVSQRAAEAMLRSLGASRVMLRISGPVADSLGNQLGLTAGTFEDVPLYPAVVRSLALSANETVKVEALVSGIAAQAAATAHGIVEVADWLLEAHGLLYGNKVLHIDNVLADQFAGTEYLYHIVASE